MILRVACALFFGCLAAAAIVTPVAIWFARKVDAVDRGGYRKIYEGAMPLLGGLGIAVPLIVLCLAAGVAGHVIIARWQWIYHAHGNWLGYLLDFAGKRNDLLILAAGGVGIVTLGLLDDIRGLRARVKLLAQIAIAIFVCLSGATLTYISIPLVGDVSLGSGWGTVVSVIWIVGLVNAFNLIDGVDGLAAGIALVASSALIILSVIHGHTSTVLLSTALAGSLLAFLFYNFYPARTFLGDTGSMFLGYVLATMSLMGAYKSEAAVIILAPMLALGVPIFETLISILRRYVRGVPIFTADNHHTHHRLLSKGYSQRQVVLTLYAVAILLAGATIMGALIPASSPWSWFPYALYGGTLVGIAWLAGYLRPTTFKRVFKRRQRNKVYHALAQYAGLSLNVKGGHEIPIELLDLCCRELGLGFIEVMYGTDGTVIASNKDPEGTPCNNELQTELRVKSSDEQDIIVRFNFLDEPDDHRRQDVTSCLAGIFDQTLVAVDVVYTDTDRGKSI